MAPNQLLSCRLLSTYLHVTTLYLKLEQNTCQIPTKLKWDSTCLCRNVINQLLRYSLHIVKKWVVCHWTSGCYLIGFESSKDGLMCVDREAGRDGRMIFGYNMEWQGSIKGAERKHLCNSNIRSLQITNSLNFVPRVENQLNRWNNWGSFKKCTSFQTFYMSSKSGKIENTSINKCNFIISFLYMKINWFCHDHLGSLSL